MGGLSKSLILSRSRWRPTLHDEPALLLLNTTVFVEDFSMPSLTRNQAQLRRALTDTRHTLGAVLQIGKDLSRIPGPVAGAMTGMWALFVALQVGVAHVHGLAV